MEGTASVDVSIYAYSAEFSILVSKGKWFSLPKGQYVCP